MRRYDKRNPQPSGETLLAASNAALARLKVPPAPPGSALARRFKKTRKR